MSYRELRNFVEIMTTLGYPVQIGIDSFRTPNFNLMADSLSWLLQRYDNSITLPADLVTEQDRIFFVKSAVQTAGTHLHIKLVPRYLYKADGYAVREVLKIANVLYQALITSTQTQKMIDSLEEEILPSLDKITQLASLFSSVANESHSDSIIADDDSPAGQLQSLKQLTQDLVVSGPNLLHAFPKMTEIREAFDDALSKDQNIHHIVSHLDTQIEEMENEMNTQHDRSAEQKSELRKIESQLSKKRSEQQRLETRISNLHSVRPAFLDELDAMEDQLQTLYEDYVEKYRNLMAMQSQLNEKRDAEASMRKRAQEQLSHLQQKIRGERLRILRGDYDRTMNDTQMSGGFEGEVDEDEFEEEEVEDAFKSINGNGVGASDRAVSRKGARRRPVPESNLFGGENDDMFGDEEDEDSDGDFDLDELEDFDDAGHSNDSFGLGSSGDDDDEDDFDFGDSL